MKPISEYTVRGQAKCDRSAHKIQLFDGKFDTGFRVKSFKIWPVDIDNGTFYNFSGKLTTDEQFQSVSPATSFNAADNVEIAWSICIYDATPAANPYYAQPLEIVDPDNFVIQDLYIYMSENSPSTDQPEVNYLIEMEKYDTNEFMGALTMVRNRSQAVGKAET